jgi:hypothetical protein
VATKVVNGSTVSTIVLDGSTGTISGGTIDGAVVDGGTIKGSNIYA